MDLTFKKSSRIDGSQKSRVSSTPASSRTQSKMSTSNYKPRPRTSELGIAEVSALDDDLDLTSSSSSGEGEDGNEETECYVPPSLVDSHCAALSNLRTRALVKVDELYQASADASADFLEVIDKDKTKVRESFKYTLEQLNEKMEELRQEDLRTAAELKDLEAQLKEAETMKHPSLGRAKQEFAKTTAQLAKVDKKLQQKRNIATALEQFMDNAGLKIGTTDDGHTTVVYTGITKDDYCFLYFSSFDLPQFKVIRAVPHFREFDRLAEEVNQSQDFMTLVVRSGQYFTRDARKLDKALEDFCSPPGNP